MRWRCPKCLARRLWIVAYMPSGKRLACKECGHQWIDTRALEGSETSDA